MEPINGRRKISILMLPWLAHGHVSPFFQLSKQLAARNFHIFFCSTPATLLSVNLAETPHLSAAIDLVALHLPPSPDLPPHLHTTNGLPPRLMLPLKRAFDAAGPAFAAVLHRLSPDLVVYDFLQPWAPAVARAAGVPAVMFHCLGALIAAMAAHMLKKAEGDFFSAVPEIGVSGYEMRRLKRLFRSDITDVEDEDRVLKSFEGSCDVILLKSFREIEGKYIDLFSSLVDQKVIAVGPLVEDAAEDIKSESIDDWLNSKEKSSCILVSFGSEFYLSRQLIQEMAHGLHLSGVNFIWVIRFPQGDERIDIEEELPEGFLGIVRNKGMVIENWAPQTQILNHPSIGGFMSHCGWSSVMESIKFGVPIIAMPMHLDQPLNARLAQRLGVGVTVERDDEGSVDREEVARVIREVVVEKRGEKVKKKMKEFSETVKKKDNEEIDVVVKELVKLCNKDSKNEYRITDHGLCYKVWKNDDGTTNDALQ